MNKKKAMYLCMEDLTDMSSGVSKKINMQCDAFEQMGYSVTKTGAPLICDTPERISRYLPIYKRKPLEYILKQCKMLPIEEYEFAYMRYPLAGRDLIQIFKYLRERSRNIKLIVEIPTYPYEQQLKSFTLFPRMIHDRLHREKLKKYIDLITTYSPDTCIFGVPSVEIANGIDVDRVTKKKVFQTPENEFHMIAVAKIADYHGFDRVIMGMKEYYKRNVNTQVFFHIVGDGFAKKHLMNLVDSDTLRERVIFHGYQSGEALMELYNKSNLAIGAIGMHRASSVEHISALKTREYCSIGIPFVNTKKDYIFEQYQFPYTVYCDDEDSPVSIEGLLSFYQNLRNQYSEQEIIENMRKFADEHLRWEGAMSPVFEYLRQGE